MSENTKKTWNAKFEFKEVKVELLGIGERTAINLHDLKQKYNSEIPYWEQITFSEHMDAVEKLQKVPASTADEIGIFGIGGAINQVSLLHCKKDFRKRLIPITTPPIPEGIAYFNAFSQSGTTSTTVLAVKEAIKKKIPGVCFVGNPESPIAKTAKENDLKLFTFPNRLSYQSRALTNTYFLIPLLKTLGIEPKKLFLSIQDVFESLMHRSQNPALRIAEALIPNGDSHHVVTSYDANWQPFLPRMCQSFNETGKIVATSELAPDWQHFLAEGQFHRIERTEKRLLNPMVVITSTPLSESVPDLIADELAGPLAWAGEGNPLIIFSVQGEGDDSEGNSLQTIIAADLIFSTATAFAAAARGILAEPVVNVKAIKRLIPQVEKRLQNGDSINTITHNLYEGSEP